MRLSLRRAGFGGFPVVPLRAGGGHRHRRGWGGNLEDLEE